MGERLEKGAWGEWRARRDEEGVVAVRAGFRKVVAGFRGPDAVRLVHKEMDFLATFCIYRVICENNFKINL